VVLTLPKVFTQHLPAGNWESYKETLSGHWVSTLTFEPLASQIQTSAIHTITISKIMTHGNYITKHIFCELILLEFLSSFGLAKYNNKFLAFLKDSKYEK
jgi:hypothetical protein